MNEINGDELLELLFNQTNILNTKIILSSDLHINTSHLKQIKAVFKKCEFIGEFTIFIEKDISDEHKISSLYFYDCSFLIQELSFSSSTFDYVYFNNTDIKAELSIHNSEINYLIFLNSKSNLVGIYSSTINSRLNVNQKTQIADFKILDSKLKGSLKIKHSEFTLLEINNCILDKTFNFKNNTIKDYFNLHGCVFQIIIFELNNFKSEGDYNILNLSQSKFNGIASFFKTLATKSDLLITGCTFNQFTHFNESIFSLLQIEQTKFIDISSFQDVKLDQISIDTTSFDKSAFFDDIMITEIQKCKKRTLRNIKQQLQRTDNKIDYDIFKAHELNSHRKEFIENKQYWFNNKDVFILATGNLFSKNGMNWSRAFWVTLLGAFGFYTIFYLLYYWSYINDYSCTAIIPEKIEEFLNGYTSFIIPTNIYNPLVPREYVKGISWLPFIIGKIFLSIGIYETIKSFRKFKS